LLKKIIQSNQYREILSSACVALANIEMESKESSLIKDTNLVTHLLQLLKDCTEEESTAIFAILNEISDRLKISPHLETCKTIAQHIDIVLPAINTSAEDDHVIEFITNFSQILSKVTSTISPNQLLEDARKKMEPFLV